MLYGIHHLQRTVSIDEVFLSSNLSVLQISQIVQENSNLLSLTDHEFTDIRLIFALLSLGSPFFQNSFAFLGFLLLCCFLFIV